MVESVISLAAFACLEFVAFRSRRISLAERSCSSFTLFVSVLCAGFSLSLSLSPGVAVGGSQWKVQTLSAGICAESVAGVVCRRGVSSLERGDYSYDVKLYASA
jgi:hypothetical protein